MVASGRQVGCTQEGPVEGGTGLQATVPSEQRLACVHVTVYVTITRHTTHSRVCNILDIHSISG